MPSKAVLQRRAFLKNAGLVATGAAAAIAAPAASAQSTASPDILPGPTLPGAGNSRVGKPRDANGNVTPDLLFRGGFPGETIGPYISQFFHQPAMFGSQPVS